MKKFLALLSLFAIQSTIASTEEVTQVVVAEVAAPIVSVREQNLRKLTDLFTNLENLSVMIKSQLDQSYRSFNVILEESLKQSIADRMCEKFKSPETVKSYMDIYDKHFSDEELSQIVVFYESAAGKKCLATLPECAAEGSQIGFRIGQEVMAEFAPQLQALRNNATN